MAGNASAVAHLRSGPAEAEVHAQVDAEATAHAIGEATTPSVQLGPMDTGAQSIHQTILLPGGEAGTCTMTLWSVIADQDINGATGYMEITSLVDVTAQERRQRAVAADSALELRTQITASLIANGADPAHRGKLRRKRQERLARSQQARKHGTDAQTRVPCPDRSDRDRPRSHCQVESAGGQAQR